MSRGGAKVVELREGEMGEPRRGEAVEQREGVR